MGKKVGSCPSNLRKWWPYQKRNANNNNARFYEIYRNAIDSVTDPELRKYFPFLLFRRDEIMYESKSLQIAPSEILKALKSIQRKYPEFELNKFNWKICS